MSRRAMPPAARRPAAVALAAALAALAGAAHGGDTAAKTNDMLGSVAGIAQDLELADVPSPIDISADRMEFQYGNGVLRYEGNVKVEHAGARILARSIEVSFEPEGKRSLRRLTARGGVEVTSGNESARGELAEYDPAARTIVLSDNARLGSGPNSLAGARVVVYLDQKKAVVEGGAAQAAVPGQAAPAAPGGRIKAVFMPDAIKPEVPGKKP